MDKKDFTQFNFLFLYYAAQRFDYLYLEQVKQTKLSL